MPSTWERWGPDADGDGLANPWNPEDGDLLRRPLPRSGRRARGHLPRDLRLQPRRLVRRPTSSSSRRSSRAAEASTRRSAPGFGYGSSAPVGADAVFRIDDLEKRLAEARKARDAAQAGGARGQGRRAAARRGRPRRRAARRQPEPDRRRVPAARARVTELVVEHDAALRVGTHAEDARRRGRPARGRPEGARSRDRRPRSPSANPSPARVSARRSTPASGVFPVGGGPSVVSVGAHAPRLPGRRHRRARGLAALRARGRDRHADASPRRRRTAASASRCRSRTARRYLYCHLSYMEPQITPGTALAAGASVGLVGSTGPLNRARTSTSSSSPRTRTRRTTRVVPVLRRALRSAGRESAPAPAGRRRRRARPSSDGPGLHVVRLELDATFTPFGD